MESTKWYYLAWSALNWLRESPAGKPVVFLMLAVLAAIWGWLRRRPRLLHGAVGAAVVCSAMIGYNLIYDQVFPDRRELPARAIRDFEQHLKPNFKESFSMGCFTSDASSCILATKYRNQLASFWMPLDQQTVFPTPFPGLGNGLCIATQSEQIRPRGALQLRAAFTAVGIDPILRVDGSLKPDEFMLIVGTRR